ncbi:MAG: Uma2 family endonuclease [Chloroflexaceae bacterium]|nr:Uma2 family endonuclease [Chloroflexaceae bacterium]
MTTATCLVEQGLTIDEKPWEDIELPPTDLPFDDGDKMESPWHYRNSVMLVASTVAARGGKMDDCFVGANMFVYYSMQQVRNQDYRGPDVFVVKDVDGTRERLSWIVWAEDGRYPDVIFELLSRSTEREDLGKKKRLYEQTFHTREYFCVSPQVERLLGWRLKDAAYVPIDPDERGWLWSEELQVWVGPWDGEFLAQSGRWLRFYAPPAGDLVLLPDEAALRRARQAEERANAEAQRARQAEERAERLRALLRSAGIEPGE